MRWTIEIRENSAPFSSPSLISAGKTKNSKWPISLSRLLEISSLVYLQREPPPSRGRSLRRLASRRRRRRYAWSERIKPHFGYSSPRLSFLSEVESRGEGDYAAEIPEKSERDLSAPFSLPSQNERFLPRRGGGGSRTCKLRPREAAIWFLARTFITGDLCCSGATLADGYKLITLVSRPASRSPFSFFLPIPRECLETRVYAWILPNRYGFLLDSQSYHGKPG